MKNLIFRKVESAILSMLVMTILYFFLRRNVTERNVSIFTAIVSLIIGYRLITTLEGVFKKNRKLSVDEIFMLLALEIPISLIILVSPIIAYSNGVIFFIMAFNIASLNIFIQILEREVE